MTRKLSAIFLMMLLMFTLVAMPVSAAEAPANDDVITGESGTTVTVTDEYGSEVVITFFDISEKEQQNTRAVASTSSLSAHTIMSGWKSLKLNSYTTLCTPMRMGDYYTIDCYNYGDNQGNGAVTFNICGAIIAVDSGKGCQATVNVSHGQVYALANWYAASYNLKVVQWY